MFLHKLKPALVRGCLLSNRNILSTKKRLPLLLPTPRSMTRCLHTLPDTKEAQAIVPLLEQIKTRKSDPTLATGDYNSVLKALASEGRSQQAQKLYDVIFRHHDVAKADMDTYSQLMLAYMNDGKFEEAMEIYYELRDHDRDSTQNLQLKPEMYETMLQALTDPDKMQMNYHQHGISCGSNNNVEEYNQEPMYEYSVQDVDTAIYPDIDGDSQPALLTALSLFNDMRHLNIQPTPAMYTNLLKSCADQKDGYVLEKVHKLIRMDLYFDPDVNVFNQLMKAYHAVGDPASVLEIWEIITNTSNVVDHESVSTVLETCLQNGYYARADAIWSSLKDNSNITADIFNVYLQCVLRSSNAIENAEKLVQEGLSTGQANESSVNILKKYTTTTTA